MVLASLYDTVVHDQPPHRCVDPEHSRVASAGVPDARAYGGPSARSCVIGGLVGMQTKEHGFGLWSHKGDTRVGLGWVPHRWLEGTTSAPL